MSTYGYQVTLALVLPAFPSMTNRFMRDLMIYYICAGTPNPKKGYSDSTHNHDTVSRDRLRLAPSDHLPDEAHHRFYPHYGASSIRRHSSLYDNGMKRGSSKKETKTQRRIQDLAVLAASKGARR